LRLNDKNIKAIEKPTKGNRVLWDDDLTGFGLRVTANDVRSFVLNYRIDGRERRTTIGKWPAWTATAARAKAAELRRGVDDGADPLAAKQQRRIDPTFGELVATYLEIEGPRQRRIADVEAMLKRDVLPHWGRTKAKDLRRRDVIALVEAKAQTAPAAANKVLGIIGRVFRFAVRREILEVSPALEVRKPGEERSKDRVLSRAELAKFWAALRVGDHFSEQTAAALRLILATAQRPGEVCGMRWADLDIKGAVWTIPAEGAKNRLSHRVPLNATALEVLEGLPRICEYVFPKARTADGPIDHNTLSGAVRKALLKPRAKDRAPLPIKERFTPHDLRRTAASFMASAGVQRFIVGQVLNHVESGVTRVYDRHGYDKEKRKALDRWDRLLRSIVAGETGGKVVRIDAERTA